MARMSLDSALVFQTNRFVHIELRPKTTQLYHSARLCLWSWRCLSLSLCLWVSVFPTLVWLGLLSPCSHQSMWGPVKAIFPILPRESLPAPVPVSAVWGWLTPTRMQSLVFAPERHISPSRQPHLHAHKSLTKLTRSHTTRHDTEQHNSVRQFAVLCDTMHGL